jgi:DMSO/TMAO reductase YedYZ molybdopterin-dependent catalytic subunit
MNEESKWSRRQILRWAGAGLVFNTAGTLLYDSIGRLIMPINDQLGSVILSPKLIPEYSAAQIQPDKLIINSWHGTPKIDPQKFRLQIIGKVHKPLSLSLTELQQLPFTSTTIQQVCVEGWAAIVQWGGVRLPDLLQMAELQQDAKYVYFSSADGYYESWDLASALHPQTMLAYEKNGAPLPPDNGAPLRLSAPIKLGYKLSKWVTEVIVTDRLLPKRGYWEDQGYDWFAGI